MTSRLRPRGLLRFAALLALVVVVGAACGSSKKNDNAKGGSTGVTTDTTKDEGTPVDGGTASIGLEAESAGWQPCVDSHSVSGFMVMSAIYDPLLSRADDGKTYGFLAESITPNADNTEWTLKLRPGVKFQDGTDLNADVLKWEWDNVVNAPTSRCAGAVKVVKSMDKVDDMTVKYTLASPYGPFPELLTGELGMPFSMANYQAKGKDVSANPVGTGPFVFKSWERDSKLTVTKNPNYWRKGFPHLDTVVFKPIPDEDARLASVTSGEVDLMQTERQQFVKQARDLGDAVKRVEAIGNNCGGSIFNVKKAPVDDKRVRKGLAYAMDQNALIKILGGEGISPPCTQFFSKDSPWYSDKVAKAYPQNNPAEGKKLIDEYKNDPKRSDGKPAGSDVTVDFNCPPDPTLVAVSQGYQQMAAGVGVKMNLNQVEQATHINNAVGKPPFTDADYMINCWRLGGQADPDSILYNQYTDPNGQAANVTNWTSPQAQKDLDTGRQSSDFKTRYAAYEDLGMIFDDEVPHVWTGATATSIVTKPYVYGVAAWKLPSGQDKKSEESFVYFANVWVKK